jgi:hypothetical protein
VTVVGFRKVTVSGGGLRRLDKRNVKAIAAGLITVGYIVITFLFAWQRQWLVHEDYIN